MIRALLDKLFRPNGSHRYRVVRYGGGWEPQISYNAGIAKGYFWFPLNEDGYWLEPDAFTDGVITRHISLSKEDAKRAILRARAINGLHISEAHA